MSSSSIERVPKRLPQFPRHQGSTSKKPHPVAGQGRRRGRRRPRPLEGANRPSPGNREGPRRSKAARQAAARNRGSPEPLSARPTRGAAAAAAARGEPRARAPGGPRRAPRRTHRGRLQEAKALPNEAPRTMAASFPSPLLRQRGGGGGCRVGGASYPVLGIGGGGGGGSGGSSTSAPVTTSASAQASPRPCAVSSLDKRDTGLPRQLERGAVEGEEIRD
ncbi:translation initiation factor IF-2-like [Choloepus didactylus]|uniref:translation initiation factor IF-2-like n=1 Tax=Choloepus didactylus TaxID=27675 RepID=UPI00189D2756|nr:translation initiation factor IF-2-like [Choloepus didactylus]